MRLIRSWLTDETTDVATRIASLKMLAARSTNVEPILQAAVGTGTPELRVVARDLWFDVDPVAAQSLLLDAWQNDSLSPIERQRAITKLGETGTPEVDTVLHQWVARLAISDVPEELQLVIPTASYFTCGRSDG